MRAARIVLAGLALLLALAMAAVALVPPMLDWNRYRGTIAALASSAVGDPVRIDGAVTLSLLPQPVLTASRIAVADNAGHFSLVARELRLRVALGALLGGRIDAQELALHGALLRLGWPPGFRPDVARMPPWLAGLEGHVEDGRILLGGLALTGIDATLAREPSTGTLAAAGTASVYGRPWHFTAHLSPPGGDGSAALELTLDGQGTLQDTWARFSGQMAADGSLAGRVSGRGSDLSQLLPAPVIGWQAEGRLSVAGGLAVADELALDLGGSPARGAVAFRVTPAPRLDLALAAGRLDLDRWLPVFLRGGEVLPTGIDLSAEAATLAGGTLRRLRAGFDILPDAVALREASATLPGDASLRLDGRMLRPAGAPPQFAGGLHLAAPDLPTTLRWLAGLGRVKLGVLPPGALRSLDIDGRLAIGAGLATLADLRGTLDGGKVRGALDFRAGDRPTMSAALVLDRLVLDPWLDGMLAEPAAWARGIGGLDLDLQLQVPEAIWRGTPIAGLALDAGLGPGRLTVRRAEATVDGVHARAAFTLTRDGTGDGRLDLATAELAPAAALIPAGWGLPASLLHGPARLQATAAGRPEALNLQLGLDLGDAHLEAAPTLDLASLAWSGPMTLRHPGAPRLLRAFGLPGAASWIGDGSLALRADLAGTPSSLAAEDIDLTAGLLHLTGRLGVRPGPVLSGQINAERLPVPLPRADGTDPLPVFDWIAAAQGWRGSVAVRAAQVLAGPDPLLHDAAATLVLGDRMLRIAGLAAGVGTGRLTGSLTLDATAEPPRMHADAQLTGLTLNGPLLGLKLDLTAGTLAGSATLDADGHSPAALLATLRGTAEASLADGQVQGFDLPGLRQTLTAQRPASLDPVSIEPAVRAALAGGQSPARSLRLAGRIAGGEVILTEGSMQSAAGDMNAAGTVDLSGRLFDLDLSLRPDAGLPELGLLITGPLAAPHRVPELAGLAAWLAKRGTRAAARQ